MARLHGNGCGKAALSTQTPRASEQSRFYSRLPSNYVYLPACMRAAPLRSLTRYLPICRVIVWSVIFVSSASKNAFERMMESTASPSNGR